MARLSVSSAQQEMRDPGVAQFESILERVDRIREMLPIQCNLTSEQLRVGLGLALEHALQARSQLPCFDVFASLGKYTSCQKQNRFGRRHTRALLSLGNRFRLLPQRQMGFSR